MNRSEPSRLEGKRARWILLALLVIPPAASVVAAAIGALNLLASVAIITSADLTVLAILLELTLRSMSEQHREVRGFKNDDDAMPFLCQLVESERPRNADLIEYSAFGAMPLLAKFGEAESTKVIRLLIGHPDTAISDYQREYRLAEALRHLAYRIPAEQARKIGLQIRCYKEIPSMRGRLIGQNLLIMGWYSFDNRGLDDPGGRPMAGGSNALVAADMDHSVGRRMAQTYLRTFENLWRDASQPDEAWEPYRAQLPHLPSLAWLKSVRAI
jgi:hypothetical protein